MSLRYSFRHLFFGGNLNKKRLYEILKDLDSANGGEASDITALEESVGALETTVGKASGEGAGGLAKDVGDLKTAIGDESTEGTILARIKALEDAG